MLFIGCQNDKCCLCSKRRGKVGYDASWVRKLKDAVSRNLTIPHKFVCLSDCEVPCERIPLDTTGDGFWAKLQLFKPGIFNGPVFYIDLDTVICKNIDDIINSVQDKKFVMWLEEDTKIHSSAMMYWNGDFSHLWDLYKSKPLDYWKEKYKNPPLYGDQALISENVDHFLFTDLTPTNWYHIITKKTPLVNSTDLKIIHFKKTHTKPSTIEHELISKHWI